MSQRGSVVDHPLANIDAMYLNIWEGLSHCQRPLARSTADIQDRAQARLNLLGLLRQESSHCSSEIPTRVDQVHHFGMTIAKNIKISTFRWIVLGHGESPCLWADFVVRKEVILLQIAG